MEVERKHRQRMTLPPKKKRETSRWRLAEDERRRNGGTTRRGNRWEQRKTESFRDDAERQQEMRRGGVRVCERKKRPKHSA